MPTPQEQEILDIAREPKLLRDRRKELENRPIGDLRTLMEIEANLDGGAIKGTTIVTAEIEL